MNAYCSRQGKALSTLRFLYDGERVSENDTPEDVDTPPLCAGYGMCADFGSWIWKMKILLTWWLSKSEEMLLLACLHDGDRSSLWTARARDVCFILWCWIYCVEWLRESGSVNTEITRGKQDMAVDFSRWCHMVFPFKIVSISFSGQIYSYIPLSSSSHDNKNIQMTI